MSPQQSPDRGTTWSLGAALGAAVAASACCTIPLALVSLGIGGAWVGSLTALEPYRWIFVTLALGALGYAGWREWQMSRQPDCDCESSLSPAVRRSVLGLGALVVLSSCWRSSQVPGSLRPRQQQLPSRPRVQQRHKSSPRLLPSSRSC